jgi:hypothetical protein
MNWFVAHMIGDFIFQNSWMADNKKQRSWPCLVHVLIYTLTIWLFTRWPWWALTITFVCHFLQDRTQFIRWWMDLVGQHKFRTGIMAPWSSVVVDNTFHFMQLFVTSVLVARYGGRL